MPTRIIITNLKPGACVINSLKLTIPGKGSAVRDAGVADDPDLVELETSGIISIASYDDVKAKQEKQDAKIVTKPEVQKSAAKQRRKKQKADNQMQPDPQPAAKPGPKPGTSFRVIDGPEEEMGRSVVVMTEDGPQVRKMNPGINASGPKFAGDEFDDGKVEDAKPTGFSVVS